MKVTGPSTMFIRTFFIQAFKIPSGSMRMTLVEGDRLMVNKLRYGPKFPLTKKRMPGYSQIERGDVIVFKYPVDMKKDFIKRLIGFGGETIEILDGNVYIDGEKVTVPGIDDVKYFNLGTYGHSGVKTLIPEGYLFVMGDNSRSSHDSRYWGFVPEENVVGKASFIYWPFSRMRIIR